MPTRKLDPSDACTPCRHPDHAPKPSSALGPGTYEHWCPGCGSREFFGVDSGTDDTVAMQRGARTVVGTNR